jgi:hypothetical protein
MLNNHYIFLHFLSQKKIINVDVLILISTPIIIGEKKIQLNYHNKSLLVLL